MNTEPVVIGSGITALVVAVLALLSAFGVDITEAQHEAILGVLAAVILLVGLVVRHFTTPAKVAAQRAQDAYIEGLGQIDPPEA